jgi:hypothetical protein
MGRLADIRHGLSLTFPDFTPYYECFHFEPQQGNKLEESEKEPA